MTLTTHAVGGAAVTLILRAHPLLGIFAAFVSHFILDAIPHWDHPIRSRIRDTENPMNDRVQFGSRAFWKDVAASLFDGFLGLLLVGGITAFTHPQHLILGLLGAAAGMLPDVLQVVFFAFPESPIRHLQRLHRLTHAKRDFNNRPMIGVPFQGITLVLLALLFSFL